MAFFFEATFIGLWIFGWDRLPRALHLASIWIATIGAWFSAYFILAANAFMQNPVGYRMAEDGSRAEMNDFFAVLGNPVALAALPHTLFAAFMMTAGVIISISAWQLMRGQNVEMMRSSLMYGLWGMIVAFGGVALPGDQLSLVMVSTQPMKMAAAEAMFDSACGADASFSIFTLGTPDGTSELFSIRVPYLLALLSTHSFDGCVEGINDLNMLYTTQEFPQFADQVDGNFAPVLWVTYWSFRWMIGLGGIAALTAVVGLWLTRKKAKRDVPQWAWKLAVWAWPASLFAILVGWVFTEMGRQPWIVFGLMLTEDGVSPSVPGWTVLISLVSFTLIYAALAVVEIGLIIKTSKKGPDPLPGPDDPDPRERAVADTPTTVY
jgi:cytochrome d ubiquinol oxidase subunit I